MIQQTHRAKCVISAMWILGKEVSTTSGWILRKLALRLNLWAMYLSPRKWFQYISSQYNPQLAKVSSMMEATPDREYGPWQDGLVDMGYGSQPRWFLTRKDIWKWLWLLQPRGGHLIVRAYGCAYFLATLCSPLFYPRSFPNSWGRKFHSPWTYPAGNHWLLKVLNSVGESVPPPPIVASALDQQERQYHQPF